MSFAASHHEPAASYDYQPSVGGPAPAICPRSTTTTPSAAAYASVAAARAPYPVLKHTRDEGSGGARRYTRQDVYGVSPEKKLWRSFKSKLRKRPEHDDSSEDSDGNYTYAPSRGHAGRRGAASSVAVVSDSDSDRDESTATINTARRPRTAAASSSDPPLLLPRHDPKPSRSNSTPAAASSRVKFVTFDNSSFPSVASALSQPRSLASSSSKHTLRTMASDTSAMPHAASINMPAGVPIHPHPETVDPAGSTTHIRYSSRGLYWKKSHPRGPGAGAGISSGSESGSDSDSALPPRRVPDAKKTNDTAKSNVLAKSTTPTAPKMHAVLSKSAPQVIPAAGTAATHEPMHKTVKPKKSSLSLRRKRSFNDNTAVSDEHVGIPTSFPPPVAGANDMAFAAPYSYYYNPQQLQSMTSSRTSLGSVAGGPRRGPDDALAQMGLYLAELFGGPRAQHASVELKAMTWAAILVALYVAFKLLGGAMRSWLQPFVQLLLLVVVIAKVFGGSSSSSPSSSSSSSAKRQTQPKHRPGTQPGYAPPQYAMPLPQAYPPQYN